MSGNESEGVINGKSIFVKESIQGESVSVTSQSAPLLDESQRPKDLEEDWNYISAKNAAKRKEHATSNVDTFVHLLKGNIGTGLLALPYATKEAGYILGPIGIFIFGVIATHCMSMLVDSARKLCTENNISSLDYAETMQFAMRKRGAKPWLCTASKVMINVFLIITQFGFCSVYFVFIANTLQQISLDIFCVDVNFRLWVLVILLPIILFSWIRNLDSLASLSALANVCILVGLSIVLYDEISRLVAHGTHEAAVKHGNLTVTGSPLPLAMFFGTAVFAYEAIGVVLPLENKMKTPEHAKKVIYIGMGSVTVLNVIFGLMGYLVYGDDIKGSVTLNLCGTNAWTALIFSITKVLFAINIFVSYLIQFYVPLDFLEPYVFKLFKTNYFEYRLPNNSERVKSFIQFGFRSLLVVITAILAVSIPDLEDLITLVGAGASSCLAFIFPPLIEMLTFGRNRKWLWIFPWPVRTVKDIVIMTMGLVGFCFGTFAALYSIITTIGRTPPDIGCTVDEESFQTACHLI